MAIKQPRAPWLAHDVRAWHEHALARSPQPHPTQWRGCRWRIGGHTRVSSSQRACGRKRGGAKQGGEEWWLAVRRGNGEEAKTGFSGGEGGEAAPVAGKNQRGALAHRERKGSKMRGQIKDEEGQLVALTGRRRSGRRRLQTWWGSGSVTTDLDKRTRGWSGVSLGVLVRRKVAWGRKGGDDGF
jgi:hypothetical protein